MIRRLLALSLLLAGCAPAISQQSMSLVTPDLTFRQVKEAPENAAGKHLLTGGAIAAVRNTGQGGELEIVQLPVDSSGKPAASALSEGRFLARADKFLDPLVYLPGLLVSLVGEVKGKEKRKLEEVEYTYPVLAVRELRLWQPEERWSEPRFHFGIGLGVGHTF